MNAYNLLDDYQKQRYTQYKKRDPHRARWFMRACISGEAEDEPEAKKIKKDPLGIALFLIKKNGYTTATELMNKSGYSHKKVSVTLSQMMGTHGLKRFKADRGEYLYYLDSARVDTRSTEQKILDLIAVKSRTRVELCIAINRTKSTVIKILQNLIEEQKINRIQTGRIEYLYTIREEK